MKKLIDIPVFLITASFVLIAFFIGCKKEVEETIRTIEIDKSIAETPIKFFSKNNVPKFTNELMVKMKDNSQKRALQNLTKRHEQTEVMKESGDNGYFVINSFDPIQDLAKLQRSPEVEWVYPNSIHTTQEVEINDPYYTANLMWGLTNTKTPAAWESGNFGSETVNVSVIDEGAGYWFCELHNKYIKNPGEIPGNGIDDDNNGKVDDVYGYNFFDDIGQIYTGNDDHGTHVDGTICAKGNNGIGIIGGAPNVKILHCKFLADWGSDNNAVLAIDYTIMMNNRYNLNIRVMNFSWGGGAYNQALYDAIQRAVDNGILVVCASGNSNQNTSITPMFPAGYDIDGIISVGALAPNDTKAGFSNYSNTTSPSAVDIFAPGQTIYSILPDANHNQTVGAYSGTSMAAPHVTYAAALWFSVNPEGTVAQCKAAIMNSARKIDALTSYCITGGTLDVSSMLGITSPLIPDATCGVKPVMDETGPTDPTNFIITNFGTNASGGYCSFKWNASTDPSGISHYELYYRVSSSPTYFYTTSSFSTTLTIFGTSIQYHEFYVKAFDKWGNVSDSSNHAILNFDNEPPPPPLPDTQAPTLNGTPTVINATVSSLTFNHDAASDNSTGLLTYTVNFRLIGGSWMQSVSNNISHLFNNLSEGTTYEFFYTAKDVAGNVSAPSVTVTGTTLITPPPPPPPPPPVTCTITTNLSAAASGPLQATLNFTSSSNCTIASRSLERKKGGELFSTIANNPTSPYIDNLPNPGNYTYRLKIVLSNGQVGYSSEKIIKVNKK